ncbi:MAG TPA: methyltransferase domain-containing protein [Pyrinomonadaceae bacterium]|nr:methyltransferase domain-containing protein [Pyrinomonadaceae bacterium]
MMAINEISNGKPSNDTFEKMDRMYRIQRHFYDLTRKYYLLGRDRLLEGLDVKDNDHVLEVGCGTGRNIILLAQRYPNSRFYGLDASEAMLDTAKRECRKAGVTNLRFVRALADDYAFERSFGLDRPFDVIFFSFSISMIPTWRESIVNAFKNLKPSGSIRIVDFYDQRDMPRSFRTLLRKWLGLFHVEIPLELIEYLEVAREDRNLAVELFKLYRGYTFIAKISRK